MGAITELEKLHPILKVIRDGVKDEGSPLKSFRGTPEIIETIWKYVTEYWKRNIRKSTEHDISYTQVSLEFDRFKGCEYGILYEVDFPEPKDININMMPFKMSEYFEEAQLPVYLEEYFNNIISICISNCLPQQDRGKIGFLTIQENYVPEYNSQRRPGLHIDSPGSAKLDENCGKEVINWGCGRIYNMELHGGIFVASNVKNSCAVWGCHIERPTNGEPDVAGELGDLEHLREYLPDRQVLEANRIYWFTDRTPHESLPLTKGQYRQFFRLVTSELSLWHEDHCTKNPLGVVPDPKITRIVKGSKFDGTAVIMSQDRSENHSTGNICVDYEMENVAADKSTEMLKVLTV